ncbi:class I SAM-dependent methyltransferase [Candidatus Accumulibacter phosphatis]|uniref:Class I SAM-dependent methyltransferase n=2 Tax=Candidatus Accumulibacter contiguus TaxID=2954381 RepID=A0ABX1T5P8_9PROT|nr:class I SAM-dependent methyltransferase [Candidatus Accumulibacter contiguus]
MPRPKRGADHGRPRRLRRRPTDPARAPFGSAHFAAVAHLVKAVRTRPLPMNDRTYIFDSELRIWRTPTHDSIAYSDGDEVERRLLSILKQTRDLSSTSDELRKQIVDWPTEYHFSPTRANLLRPFRIDKSQRILELGCGCGNLTRYLGESGAHVTAVEGSVVRASIAAERCRDLANVMIVADSIELFTSAGGFDMVTLIGVLEYAPLFFRGR